MKATEIPSVVALIATIWPNAPQYRAEHLEAFHAVLEPCSTEGVRAALVSLSREGRPFAPNAGEVYRRVQDLVSPTPDSSAAWAEVMRWVRGKGYVNPPQPESFSHPAVYAALDRVGYQTLCESETAAEGVWFAHFRRAYESSVGDLRMAPAREELAASELDALMAGGAIFKDVPE